MSDQPGTLKLFVKEEIKTSEAPPGTPASVAPILDEERIAKEKVMTEYIRLIGRYVVGHNVKSRWVTSVDISKVLVDAKDLLALISLPRGRHSSVAALAHPQIDDKDPLRFFVLPNGMIIINPIITNHTKYYVLKDEGCMSFSDKDIKNVNRFHKITVTYQTLVENEDPEKEPILSKIETEELSGRPAQVFQHECGHLNGCNIYDDTYSPEFSLGLGKEIIK